MKYRKIPIEIVAFRYTRDGIEAERIANWCGGVQTDDGCEIETLEGVMLANYGDWIIQGVKGEFYPCKPDIFKLTYTDSLPTPPTKPVTDAEIEKEAEDYAKKEVLVYLELNPFPEGFDKNQATGLMDLFFNQSKKDCIYGVKWAITRTALPREGEEGSSMSEEDINEIRDTVCGLYVRDNTTAGNCKYCGQSKGKHIAT